MTFRHHMPPVLFRARHACSAARCLGPSNATSGPARV